MNSNNVNAVADGVALNRNLGMIEAIGLSISIVAPTMAVAFNVALAAGVAGRAAPLAFAVGTVALAIVGLSFVGFARRIAHAGSAYAYITKEFGARVGFIAGWAMLLTYLTYGGGTAAMAGSFIDTALANYHISIPGLWIPISILAILFAMFFTYRDMQLAARLMLVMEGISILAVVILGVIILVAVGHKGGLSTAPFVPDPHFGWSGVGYAMVFAVLSFAGFEGATTLGEETRNPGKAIPIAVIGAVILSGIFYVFGSYAQVVGYGLQNCKALANDSMPLNTLAIKYVTKGFATFLDVAAAISAFSCVMGSMSGAARMLFALGRAGLVGKVGVAHKRHRTPAIAVLVVGILMIVGQIVWAPQVGAGNYYGDVATIGTLLLILVYMGVTLAEATNAAKLRKLVWIVFGIAGAVILIWPLYNSVYPVPAYPGNLWPYIALAYLAIGVALLFIRPALGRMRLDADI